MFSDYLCHCSEETYSKNICSFILHMTTLLYSWNIMLMQSDTITVEKTSHTPGIFCQQFMTVAACYTIRYSDRRRANNGAHMSLCLWRGLMLQRNCRYLYLWKGVANERCLCWNTSLCDCYLTTNQRLKVQAVFHYSTCFYQSCSQRSQTLWNFNFVWQVRQI
jgi:hypothetical protein